MVQLSIQAAKPTGGGKFRGVAYAGGELAVSGYSRVVVDLDGLTIPGSVPLASDHSAALASRVGMCAAIVANGQLHVEGQLVEAETDAATMARELLKVGGLSLSIGVDPTEIERIPAGKTVVVNGQTFISDGDLEIVRRGTLKEISAVGIGADSQAVAVAASWKRDSKMTATSEAIQAERDRISGIRAAFKDIDDGGEVDRLIEAGAGLAEARGVALERLRSARPSVRANSGEGGPDEGRVHTAALLSLAGRADLAASRLGAREAEEGEALARRAGSLLAVGTEVLRARGIADPGNTEARIRAAFSTNGLSGPMSTAISMIALDAFVTADESWRSFAYRTPLSDFKENTLIRLAGSFRFQSVPKDGELKHSSLDGETTAIKLGTSGTILQLDRQALVNDGGVGLLAQVPAEMAREGARTIGDDLWDLIASNPNNFFHDDNGNYIEGASTVLGQTGFSEAVAALRSQTDSSGRRLNKTPKWLIVPPALEAEGRRLLSSGQLVGDDGEGASNPWRGSAELLVEARITSATEWYLFGENRNATAVVGTLNGADAPVVEEREPGPEVLGRVWRAFIDHGVALHETRGAVKSKGAS